MSKAKVSSSAPSESAISPKGESSRWFSLAVATLAIALVVLLGLYGMRIFRDAAFSDERAFRVLNEITDQLDNFQITLASLPDLAPESAETDTGRLDLSNLAVQGLKGVAQNKNCAGENARDPEAARFAINLDDPQRAFSLTKCVEATNRVIELRGTLDQQLGMFVEQRFFDTVVISMDTGRSIASISREPVETARVRLHESKNTGLSIVDASGLLRHAARQEERDEKEAIGEKREAQKTTATVPSHPMVFNDTIAGESYRVFVHPFEPAYAMSIVRNDPSAISGTQPPRLYLIGLKEQSVLDSFAAALGSRGALIVTLLALLTVMGWPLLSLRFLPPQDAITRTHFLLVLTSLISIPSILTAAGFAVWSLHRLTVRADHGAELYARQIERSLLEELSKSATALDRFAEEALLKDCSGKAEPRFTVPCEGWKTPEERTAFDADSRLRLMGALNDQGQSSGFIKYVFGQIGVTEVLKLADREYFKAIHEGQEWRPAEWSASEFDPPARGLVAQRLFNRSDAARVLQIAVPIEQNGKRVGVATGDTRAYALAHSANPPLLRFAVVDNTSGIVLFHSEDSRSLAENLLIETEGNVRLRVLMSKRSSPWLLNRVSSEDHFEGRYLGEPHRFYYRPVAGIPWSVVVMYSSNDIAAVIRQATLATLATYFGAVVAVFVALGLISLVSPGRPDRDVLTFLWPKWRSRGRYAQLVVSLLIALTVAAVLLVLWAPHRSRPEVTWEDALLVLCIVSPIVIWMRRSVTSKPRAAPHLYQNNVVCCLTFALVCVAVAPTTWLAIRYHDASLRAFLWDELRQAGTGIARGYSIIEGDLRRWTANAPDNRAELDSWAIARSRLSPAFEASEAGTAKQPCATWAVDVYPQPLWFDKQGPGQLDPVRHAVWSWSSGVRASRGWTTAGERLPTRADPCQQSNHVVSFRSRTHDGHRFILGMPKAQGGEAATFAPEYDADARMRVSSVIPMFVAIAGGLIVALALLSWHVARRLFGIRIPFAGRYLKAGPHPIDQGPLLEAEVDLMAHAKKHRGDFTPKDEMDWRLLHCEAHYKRMWADLERDEQLLVHQLAKGSFANPENQSVIERLIRRGYLTLRPWPRVSDCGFEAFARTAEPEQTFAKWQAEASHGVWSRIRTPLLVIVLALAVLLTWLAGSTMQIVYATLAGVAALFTSFTQVTSILRKEGKPLASGADQ